jgi:hypothetical protein
MAGTSSWWNCPAMVSSRSFTLPLCRDERFVGIRQNRAGAHVITTNRKSLIRHILGRLLYSQLHEKRVR